MTTIMSPRIFTAVSVFVLTSCAGGTEEEGTAFVSSVDTATPVAVVAPTGPQIQFFSFSDSVMAVVDGAGCGYSAPGITGDSSLFAFSIDGVIQVDGRLEVLKMVGEGTYTDSTGESRWENTRYRLRLRVQDDGMVEGGVNQHGEMTVEEKATGATTTVALVGGCGC